MALITRTISRDWYAGASVYYTVYSSAGEVLVARTAMTESPAGSGSFTATIASWDTSWVGRIVYDDGSIFESEAFFAVNAALSSFIVDGIPLVEALNRILSAVGGVVSVTYNAGGSITLSFKALDGTTELFTRTFDPATGART